MSTLETQYEQFLLENPDAKFTFEEWKEEILKPAAKKIIEHTEALMQLQKMTQKILEEEKLKQNK